MRRLALLPALTLIALAGCGSTTKPSNPPAPGAPKGPSTGDIQVTMKNFSFQPKTIHAIVGETVQWTNRDSAPHNVTPVSGPSFTASPTLTNGQRFSLTLRKPGTITYFCSIHPFMKATIVVAPASSSSS